MKQIMHSFSTMRYFVVILLVAFALNEPLSAQEVGQVEDEDFFEMSLEELVEVEFTTASKKEEKLNPKNRRILKLGNII